MLPKFHPDLFFPGAQVTTPFGWDTDTATRFPELGIAPRIHHAIDKAGRGLVCAPFGVDRVEWHDKDALGCSVLRLFAIGEYLELRILHFRKAELSPALADAIARGIGLPAGAPLAPAGDVGLSSARHAHYSLLVDPAAYGLELTSMRPGWAVDRRMELAKRFGPAFEADCRKRGIHWINEVACGKADPWTQKDRVILDSMAFFGF